MGEKFGWLISVLKPPPHLRKVVLVFVVGGFLLLVFAVQLLLAKARITLLAKEVAVKSDVAIVVGPDQNLAGINGVVLQKQVVLEQTLPVSASSLTALSVVKFKITSTLPRAQTLIARTRIAALDNSLVYRIGNTVAVGAGSTLRVEASLDSGQPTDLAKINWIIPGLNPATSSFFKIEYVAEATPGDLAKVVNSSDIEAGVAVLTTKAVTEISSDFKKQIGNQFTNFDQIISEVKREINPKIGLRADLFSLKLTLVISLVAYNQKEVTKFLSDRFLQANVGSVRVSSVEGVEALKLTVLTNKKLALVGPVITWQTISTATDPLNRERLVGVSVDAAKRYLESVAGISSASIKLSPFWLTQLPSKTNRIFIEVR